MMILSRIFRFNPFMFLCILLLQPLESSGIGDTRLCSSPLGMESKRIPDSALSASSFYVTSVGPHQARLNTENAGGAWCPKVAIAIGTREFLQISLNKTHIISGVQVQGRYAGGTGQEYTEEFEIEYWREGFDAWKKYFRFDGKTVLQGNSDTNTVVTAKLRPPLFAQIVRLLPYSTHKRTVCLRAELLGCKLQGGIVQYRMEQGDVFSEGISLKDESYDGQGSKWDREVEVSDISTDNKDQFTIFQRPLMKENESNKSEGKGQLLTGGLGQLTDTIEGDNSFTMDMGYGLGNGWVGWRQVSDSKDSVKIMFSFDEVKVFKSLHLYTNNYPSKGLQIFSKVKVLFSIGGNYFNGKPVMYVPMTDVTLEQATNITIPMDDKVARFIQLQLYFRSHWIVLGEVYFHSEPYNGNYTMEAGPDAHHLDTKSSIDFGDLDSSVMETVFGIISALFLVLVIGGFVIWSKRAGCSLFSCMRLQRNGFPFWRSSWGSVPTHIVAQTNPAAEGVKDLLLTLTPLSNGGNGATNAVVAANGEFKGHSAPYTNGTLSSKNSNGHFPEGIYKNKYGSMDPRGIEDTPITSSAGTLNINNDKNIGCLSGKQQQQQTGSNLATTNRFTLRSNHLATLDDSRQVALDEENVYEEASTLPINSAANTTSSMEATTATTTSSSSSTKTRARKGKIANSCWNLSSAGKTYKNHRGRLVTEVSLRQLRLVETLGSCLYGQVQLYDFDGEIACHEEAPYSNCRVIVKTAKSMAELRLLNLLDHEHVSEIIAVCKEMKTPLLALYPAPECGDLCSFLSGLANTPSLNWLLSAGAQIASGMNYLESLGLIHRDLAARNCLVEREGSIRIADLAMACEQYQEDYCHTSNGLAPLRWWSWESIIMDGFTMGSSVWSFGVTLWEILTLCRYKPLADVPDHEIFTLAKKYGSSAASPSQDPWLPPPILSPPEIYDLMRECWQLSPSDRPTFQRIHLFLEQKCDVPIYHALSV